MKVLLLIAIFIVMLSACEKSEKGEWQSEIYLVRHFQKQVLTVQSGKDVELTEEGHINAKRLAKHLKNRNISAIYSTNYKRTKQTAIPTSESTNVPVSIYNPEKLENLAAQLLGSDINQLVVGHSNTTGVLFGLLGCETIVLSESDYGDIMVLKRLHTGSDSTIMSCSNYRLPAQAPIIANLLYVKQSKLHDYFVQTNTEITINKVPKTESSKNGIVEVGFILDEEGNSSSFEIVKSSPEGRWHEQAVDAAKQLHFSPLSSRIPKGKNVYTTWVFEFTAN